MIPVATIAHYTPGRVRFRLPSQKGNRAYFAETAEVLARELDPDRLEANPATGSLLILDRDLDLDSVLKTAEDEGLFRREAALPAPLAREAIAPLRALSERLRETTFGRIDLANLAFFALLGVGTYQLLRGNLRSPPWYTAFWYAMGIYVKHVADKAGEETPSA
jgi:hypothetical protein